MSRFRAIHYDRLFFELLFVSPFNMQTAREHVLPPHTTQGENRPSCDEAITPNDFGETDTQVRELLNTFFELLDEYLATRF